MKNKSNKPTKPGRVIFSYVKDCKFDFSLDNPFSYTSSAVSNVRKKIPSANPLVLIQYVFGVWVAFSMKSYLSP